MELSGGPRSEGEGQMWQLAGRAGANTYIQRITNSKLAKPRVARENSHVTSETNANSSMTERYLNRLSSQTQDDAKTAKRL